MKVQSGIFYKHYRLFVVPVVFCLYYLLTYLINPFSKSWEGYFQMGTQNLLTEWGITMVFCSLITESSIVIARVLDKSISWREYAMMRFITQIFLQIISVGILLYFFDMLWDVTCPIKEPMTSSDRLGLWQYFFIITILSIIISAVHTGNFFLQRWKVSTLEASELKLRSVELKEIAMQAELQSLKLQLDPHFMFNNFSTLSELISEDKETAQKFLDNLSRVYRYMILNLNNDIITLKEEIRFLEAYNYLIGIRYGDKVHVNIDIPEAIKQKGIPPITLQLLIENAIKHNVACEGQPLVVNISLHDSRYLKITNNLQPIQNNIPSTKIGLENIKNRYRILCELSVEVLEEEDNFTVILPLLDFKN
jgi:two-component system LytT family sensor kinase